MPKFVLHLVNAFVFLLIALFIAIQQDVEIGFLTDGWMGLRYAMYLALGAGAAHLWAAFKLQWRGEIY